ncbi:MAG: hypothetical protein ABI002_11230 [Saprospiraceae bacterium]
MSQSLNLTDAAAYRAYVEQYSDEILQKMLFGFASAKHLKAFEGVKGKLVLTEMIIGNVIKRYSSTFAPTANLIAFKPRVLETVTGKVDVAITPKEFEASYLGARRQKGQNSEDLPFEALIVGRLLEQMQKEYEIAVWKAVSAVSPAATDTLAMLTNGYLKIVADLIAATTKVPVVTGAITSANAYTNFHKIYNEGVDESLKDEPLFMFCAPNLANAYKINVFDSYTKYLEKDATGNNKLLIGDVTIIPTKGMAGSGRVILTPANNLLYGYDAPTDGTTLNIEQEKREIHMWTDLMFGVQIGIIDDGYLVVNDQA